MRSPQHEADRAEIVSMIGLRFRHFKGGEYKIHCAVFDATEDRWVIGYRENLADPTLAPLFTRTLEDFKSEVTRPRFEVLP